MLSIKQGGMKYDFLNLRYDSTWDWTPVSQVIHEHSASKPIIELLDWCKQMSDVKLKC